jgi:hypothetical protein
MSWQIGPGHGRLSRVALLEGRVLRVSIVRIYVASNQASRIELDCRSNGRS